MPRGIPKALEEKRKQMAETQPTPVTEHGSCEIHAIPLMERRDGSWGCQVCDSEASPGETIEVFKTQAVVKSTEFPQKDPPPSVAFAEKTEELKTQQAAMHGKVTSQKLVESEKDRLPGSMILGEWKVDVANYHQVRVHNSEDLVILRPPAGRIKKDDALIMAAHIVRCADPTGERFARILEEVMKLR